MMDIATWAWKYFGKSLSLNTGPPLHQEIQLKIVLCKEQGVYFSTETSPNSLGKSSESVSVKIGFFMGFVYLKAYLFLKLIGYLTLDDAMWGDVAQEVELSSGSRRVAGSIHPGRVEVSLSKTPNPQLLLTSWLVPCMAANRRWCVNVCVNG